MPNAFRLQPGDQVAFSAAFLQSIGAYSGELPALRGEVTSTKQLGARQLAYVRWQGEQDSHAALSSTLARVGPNRRFAAC